MAKYTQKRKLLKVKSRKNNKTGKRLKRRVKKLVVKGGDDNVNIKIANIINGLEYDDKLLYYNADDNGTENIATVLSVDDTSITFDKELTVNGNKINNVVQKTDLLSDIIFDYNSGIDCFENTQNKKMKIMRKAANLIKKNVCRPNIT